VTTHVERSIEVAVPVRTAYDQWTRFEEFPHFMSGVEEVRQVGDAMTHWIAQIAGVRREWDAEIVAQVPDEKVAWAATTGATNAGAVFFDEVGADRTRVRLTLEFEPEGLVERIGDVLDIVDRQAVADLDRFKEFIEKSQGPAAGGWRGTIEDGDVVSESTGQQTNAAGTAEGVPDARTASHAGGTGDLVGEVGTGGHHTGDDPGSRTATSGTDEAWASGGSGPGEDSGVRATGEDGVVQRDFADEDISTDDVVARDFANRDISGEGVVERDFADRDITERDIANRGATE
jgi:carbon monoxide dehydrogenase subunit G